MVVSTTSMSRAFAFKKRLEEHSPNARYRLRVVYEELVA